jgi:hypothetical protein
MRRRFHMYLVVMVVFLGGGLASALLAQGSGAAPGGQHSASVGARAANRAGFTKKLVGYLRKRGFQVNPGYPLLYSKDPAATCNDYQSRQDHGLPANIAT